MTAPPKVDERIERQVARVHAKDGCDCICQAVGACCQEVRNDLLREIAAGVEEARAETWTEAGGLVADCINSHGPKDESGCMTGLKAEFYHKHAYMARSRAAAIREGRETR